MPTDNLGQSASRGGIITLAGQFIRIILQLSSLIVLARLLTPAEYGLVAMLAIVTATGEVVREFGLIQAVVRAPEFTVEQRNKLFWINTALGVAVGLIVFASAPLIARLVGEPGVEPLAKVLALVFVLNGVSTQYRASLNREMKYVALTVTECSAALAALIAAILVALSGGGEWSLVVQQVLFALISLTLCIIVSGWLPGTFPRRTKVSEFLRFGANLLGVQLLVNTTSNVDRLLLGFRSDAAVVGTYDRAAQAVFIPLGRLSSPSVRVALPTLGRLLGDDRRFSRFLLTGQTLMVQPLVAGCVFAMAAAAPLVSLVLGDGWEEAIPLFRIFCIAGIFKVAGFATYWVFLAKGLTASHLRYTVITRIIMLGLLFLGCWFGALGVATAFATSMALFWLISILWLPRITTVPSREMFRNCLFALTGWSIPGVIAWFAVVAASQQPELLQIAVGLLSYSLAGAALAFLIPPFRRQLLVIWKQLRSLRARGGPKF